MKKKQTFNPFKLNEISYSYQVDQSIFVLLVVGLEFSFLFKSKSEILQASSEDPYQTLHSVASDLCLHCLPATYVCPTKHENRMLGLYGSS